MTRRVIGAWPWVLLAAGLIAMLPGLLHRVEIESESRDYETAVLYSEITPLSTGGVSIDSALDELHEAGVTSVAVHMQKFGDLERQGRVTLLDRADLLSLLLLTGGSPSDMPAEGDAFILIADDDPDVLDRIRRAGAPNGAVEPITVGGQRLYQVSGIEGLANLQLGYDHDEVRNILSHGLSFIASVPDTVLTYEFVTQELAALRDEFGIDRIILFGKYDPLQRDAENSPAFADWLRDEGFTVLLLDVPAVPEVYAFAERVGRIARLRQLGVNEEITERTITDAVRAIRERNIRVLVLRVTPDVAARGRVDLLVDSMRQLQTTMPAEFRLAEADPVPQVEPTLIHTLGGIAAAAGIAAATGALLSSRLAIAAGGLVALLAAGAAIRDSTLLGDLTRLATAGLASVLAVYVARPRPDLPRAATEYAKAGLVVLAGGLAVAGLAYDEAFLVAARDFWGVKALLIGPPLLAAGVAAYMSLGNPTIRDAMPILNLPVRAWHVAAFLLVAGVVGFLVLRSGNTTIELDVELLFREQLESVLGIRPRTKELLFGWPALLLGILAITRSRHGWWLYVVAAVATSSAVDTFTHFHTPLVVSIVRTVYGIGLGFAIGLLVLGLIRLLAGPVSRALLRPQAA